MINFMAKPTKNSQMLGSDKDFLRLSEMPVLTPVSAPIRLVDLFCGCGGITLGCVIAAHELGRSVEIPLAVDFNNAAIDCYKANFPHAEARCADITTMLESDWQAELKPTELKLREQVGSVDILVGGPPCQGHSDLNNFTRRRDPKNQLMQYMARAAVVFKPKSIVVENVVGSLR
jgi:DNA (cytosine-5)-methyltransferase 1